MTRVKPSSSTSSSRFVFGFFASSFRRKPEEGASFRRIPPSFLLPNALENLLSLRGCSVFREKPLDWGAGSLAGGLLRRQPLLPLITVEVVVDSSMFRRIPIGSSFFSSSFFALKKRLAELQEEYGDDTVTGIDAEWVEAYR